MTTSEYGFPGVEMEVTVSAQEYYRFHCPECGKTGFTKADIPVSSIDAHRIDFCDCGTAPTVTRGHECYKCEDDVGDSMIGQNYYCPECYAEIIDYISV